MSELDRRGEAAATALLDEITSAETEEALSIVRATRRGTTVDRPRWGLLAVAAAAIVVLVGGVALLKSRDTEEVEPPLATPPGTVPSTNTPTAPATIAPTSPATTAISPTQPATSAPVTAAPATTEATTTTIALAPDVPPLAEQPGFGGASEVLYASGGEIIVAGWRDDDSPVLWRWSDATATWSATALPGDNTSAPVAFVDSQSGYAFVDGYLQRTADAGATWERVDIASPSGAGISVIDIAVGAGYVHVLGVDQDGAMAFRIYTMPIDGDAFTPSSVEFPPPAGGEPGASFAFDDRSGWMAVTSRTLMGAARFVDGQWADAPDVTCVNGGVTFAASGTRGDFVRSCDSGYMGSDGSIPEGTQIDVSSDGGDTFSPVPLFEVPAGTDPQFFSLLDRPEVGTIVIGLQGGSGAMITYDEGVDWQPLGLPDGSQVSDLATGDDLWVAVGYSNFDGGQAVWVSRDSGASWSG